jgi:DNA processing protein
MKLIAGLAGYPIVIVSGLAIGIDAIAHEAALEAKLLTIAFPGSSLLPSEIVPPRNRDLAKRILEHGGCLLSEFSPQTPGGTWMFPRRNRLMAGMSRATLVIEAEQKSGTLITSKLATDYNRDVLAVPGNIMSPTSRGTNMLIRMGATPITKSEDILEALGYDVHSTDKAEHARQSALFDCSPEEKNILEVLREPMTRDDICEAVHKPMYEVNITLSVMELKGLIKEEYGEVRRL